MVNARSLLPLFGLLLAGCPWVDPSLVACMTDHDCIEGYHCNSPTPVDVGTCVAPRRGGGDDDDTTTSTGPVSGLDLVGVSVNQGVEIELLAGDDWIDHRNADIVAGRPGIVRLYVEPQDVWEPRSVRATVAFDDGREITVEETVSNNASSEGSLNSTINVELAAEDVVPDVGFSVRLEEVGYETDEDGVAVAYEGTREATRWPREADAFEDFDARTSGVIDLRIVPVRYNADGSGRLPDVSDGAIGVVRDQMMKMYPTQEVRVTVESPMDWSYNVSPNGNGWSELLQQIYYLRDQRNMPGDSYTYGMFAPAADRYSYCSQGCVAGLSINVEQASYSDSRVSIGLGYGDVSTGETMAHEVGHAHGRSHAPCSDFGGIQGVDPNFPYNQARRGVMGYDIVDGVLKDADAYADLMAYCSPVWVSDYTWNAFNARIRAVGPQAQIVGGPAPQEQVVVIVGPDGLRSPRRVAGSRFVPGGELRATARDADGATVSQGAARFLPFDHLDGGLLVFPAPPEGASSVEVAGYGVVEL